MSYRALVILVLMGVWGTLANLAWGEAEIPLCTQSDSIQINPAVGGPRVVWQDWRSSNPDIEQSDDIYLLDLVTGMERPICLNPEDQLFPAVDGDRVVWLDNRRGNWAIYLYDLTTGLERFVSDAPTTRLFESYGPDISGDLIVWADERYHPTTHKLDIFMYNLANDTLTRITDEEADQGIGGPRIDGNKLVWCDTRNDPSGDIYMYDVSLQQEFIVANDPGSESQPDISGTGVVWTKSVGEGVWNIWFRDLATPTPAAALDTSSYTQSYPRISGRWVAWNDDRLTHGTDYYHNVWIYDLLTAQNHTLPSTCQSNGYAPPAVSASGFVAWADWRNGNPIEYNNSDIYAYILTRFYDVLADHWAYDAIESCVAAGIVSGYPEGDYKPSEQVTRAQMAVYISRAMAGGEDKIPEFTGTPTFDDVDADYWALKHVEYAVSVNVVRGYEDDLYHPTDIVDRGQMAVFIARSKGWVQLEDDMTTAPELFPDVPAGFWAGTAVQACVYNGVVYGYTDGYYRPAQTVSRDQMAIYVARAFNLLAP